MKEKKPNLTKEKSKNIKKSDLKKYPSLNLKKGKDIAADFSEKVYERFDKLIKSVILFGSSAKNTAVLGSDIDIIIILDDATVNFNEKLIRWYREELGKIIDKNPYKKDLHINTIKLTTWWQDLNRGDPTIINIIRYGESILDYGGFFRPLKIILNQGKIRPSPEAMYAVLNRVPEHIIRSRISEMSAIEGCYWAMVETSQALLMAINVLPPSPEHITRLLKEHFVDKKILKSKHVSNFKNLYDLHKEIIHNQVNNLDGKIIDNYQEKSEDFFKTALKIIKEII